MQMKPDDHVAYVRKFTTNLGEIVNQALEINNLIIAHVKVSALYPSELLVEAASVGFEMNLPVDAAIAYLVIAEGMRFERSHNRFSLGLSPTVRKKHNEHLALARQVDPLIHPFKGTKIGHEFMERLVKGMSRISSCS